jgi:phosphoribosylformylglycinamidine synthase
MQDMGAAGITCSTSEMSAKAGVGMDIWLDKVPTRQENMLPFEILISESQERMLIVAEQGRENEILTVFDKWDLPCVQIGVVTEGPMLNYYLHHELVAQVPAQSLVLGGGAPVYEREWKTPVYIAEIQKYDETRLPPAPEVLIACKALASNPIIASKARLTQQYDSMVGASTITTNQPADAAIVSVNGTEKGVAMTTDCNSRYVYLNPQLGCAHAVAEAARNLACTGAVPLGVTNCLNFGNPYNPEVYYQFKEAILGMKLACEAFNLPVTGGNVSFYNQSTDDGPVFPTPTIGMVGLLKNVKAEIMTLNFKQVGDKIFVLGNHSNPWKLQGSEYLYSVLGVKHSPAPELDLELEARLQKLLVSLAHNRFVQSLHDCSEGGLFISLLESCVTEQRKPFGFKITKPNHWPTENFLFSEQGGRVVASVSATQEADFIALCQNYDVAFLEIGTVTNDGEFVLEHHHLGKAEDYAKLYNNSLAETLGIV